jgi:hypothetical protein
MQTKQNELAPEIVRRIKGSKIDDIKMDGNALVISLLKLEKGETSEGGVLMVRGPVLEVGFHSVCGYALERGKFYPVNIYAKKIALRPFKTLEECADYGYGFAGYPPEFIYECLNNKMWSNFDFIRESQKVTK